MPDQATLEALRDGYWPLYVLAMGCGAVAFLRGSSLSLGRTLLAMAMGSVIMTGIVGINGGHHLAWWQHLLIDVPVLAVITLPPRHYWQATLGGLVFAQIFLHVVWAFAPELAREHWFGNILFGYAKCLVILLWAGGKRVQSVLDTASRLASRVVLAARRGKPA